MHKRLQKLHQQWQVDDQGMALQRERMHALQIAAPTRAISSFNLFQTPSSVADTMAAAADIYDHHRVLEPSAGLGRLYQAIRWRANCHLTMVEISPACCSELYRLTASDHHTTLIQGDFLAMTQQKLGEFDRIIMNSPFKMGADVQHIQHAAKFLAPHGLIVALCFNGRRQNQTLKSLAHTWDILPPESFKSEGTRASVVLLTIKRAADSDS